MKQSTRLLLTSLVLVTGSPTSSAFAAADTCWWEAGSGPLHFQPQLGTLYVPRDAAVGSVIGTLNKHTFTSGGGSQLDCSIDTPGIILNFQAQPTAPLFAGQLPPVDGIDVNGKVFNTNIPGVGALIRLDFPFDGSGNNTFIPIGGPTYRPIVPFDGYQDQITTFIRFTLRSLRTYTTLIKTGPIPTGPNPLDGRELFSGTFTGVGKGFGVGPVGTVIQAHCGISGNPVSVNPVPLGTWDTSEFTGPGFGTILAPFTITLSACEADPSDGNIAVATIKLDGVLGSVPVDENNGVFSLTADSGASGVGVQILRGDGLTPVALGMEVPLVPITSGTTVLDFNARFYQIAPHVDPGVAKGALNFTMTYK